MAVQRNVGMSGICPTHYSSAIMVLLDHHAETISKVHVAAPSSIPYHTMKTSLAEDAIRIRIVIIIIIIVMIIVIIILIIIIIIVMIIVMITHAG